MSRPIHIRRRLVSPGCPAWFATVVRGTASITSAYYTQPEAVAAIPDLLAILDAPPRETATQNEGWTL